MATNKSKKTPHVVIRTKIKLGLTFNFIHIYLKLYFDIFGVTATCTLNHRPYLRFVCPEAAYRPRVLVVILSDPLQRPLAGVF